MNFMDEMKKYKWGSRVLRIATGAVRLRNDRIFTWGAVVMGRATARIAPTKCVGADDPVRPMR